MAFTAEVRKPPHPLAGAFERVLRAKEHLAELKSGVELFRQQNEDAATIKFDPQNPNVGIVQVPMLMPPLRFSILVGEVCYNLRGALDYLIYELARLDSGGVAQDDTQFPVYSSKKAFDGNAERLLKGVNPTHRACIEDLQPYKGCNWTGDLVAISNPDKHRKLTSVTAATEQLVTIAVGTRDPLDPNAGTIKTAVRPDGTEMHMQLSLTTDIRLDDGTPILQALDNLASQVAETLDALKPEFK